MDQIGGSIYFCWIGSTLWSLLRTSGDQREHAVEPALGRGVVERQSPVAVGDVHLRTRGNQQVQTLGTPAIIALDMKYMLGSLLQELGWAVEAD